MDIGVDGYRWVDRSGGRQAGKQAGKQADR